MRAAEDGLADGRTVRGRNTPKRVDIRSEVQSSGNLAGEQPRRHPETIRLDSVQEVGVAFESVEIPGNRKIVPAVHTALFITRYEVSFFFFL